MGKIIMRILWVIVGLCAVAATLVFVAGISEVKNRVRPRVNRFSVHVPHNTTLRLGQSLRKVSER